MALFSSKSTATGVDPYAAFRVPYVVQYFLGSLLLMLGMGAQSTVIGWELYRRTNDPLVLGLAAGVQAIPMLLLSLPAGMLADHVERKRILLWCYAGVVVCSIGLAWTSWNAGPIWMMLLLLGCDATCMSICRPASATMLPTLVPRETLENAMKWRTSLFQISGLVGPAIGGYLILVQKYWHLPAAYLINACSAVIFIFLLATFRIATLPEGRHAASLENTVEGIRFVWSRKIILATLSLDLFAVLLGGAVYLLPIFAKDILRVGDEGLGWLRAAPAAGALVTAAFLIHMPPMKRAGRAMLLAVAGFGVATIIFGFSRNFWLSMAMLFLTGLFDNISVVVRHTLVQLLTPDNMRGRVNAVNAIFIGSSNELGGLESGLIAKAFSPVISVVSGGIGTMLVVALWSGLFPGLRKFGALADAKPEEPAPELTPTLTE